MVAQGAGATSAEIENWKVQRWGCKLLLLPLAISAGFLTTVDAGAQPYPARQIQMLVPFSAGHHIDILARLFARGLETWLRQPIVIINREGAGGTLAFAATAQAAPDGYTLLFGAQGQLTIQPYLKKGLPYSLDSLQPVCQVFENIFGAYVGPQSPYKDFKSLLEHARANPKRLTWATGGEGTVSHLQMSGIIKEANLEMTFVPYRNFPTLMQDVLGGRIDFGVTSVGGYATEARTLAILADRRHEAFSDIPTVAELGYRVSMPGFGGIYMPRQTPGFIVGTIEKACERAYNAPEYQVMAKKIFSSAPYLPSAAFAKRIADDHREKGALIESSGLADK